jgi:hypothetical protein
MDQAERRFVSFRSVVTGGHGPFRGLDAPRALVSIIRVPIQPDRGSTHDSDTG